MKISVRAVVSGLCIAALGLTLAACGGRTGVQPTAAQNQGANQSQTSGMNQGQSGQEMPMPQSGNQAATTAQKPAQNVVYFDFNKSDIQPQYTDLLTQTANYLMAHPNVQVRLEGYTDERGTKAYNLALGDRRAQAVQRFLVLQGVSDSQIKTVSYGEEDPADPAHNDAAWAKNRRVVIAYLQ